MCRESEEWCKEIGVDKLPRGTKQPFYTVLVDERDAIDNTLVAYVAEDALISPQEAGEETTEPIANPYMCALKWGDLICLASW